MLFYDIQKKKKNKNKNITFKNTVVFVSYTCSCRRGNYGSQAKVDKSFALRGDPLHIYNKIIYRAFGIIIVCLFFEKERSGLI